MSEAQHDAPRSVLIIGAGPAGLACAATLKAKGVTATVLEKADAVGSVWRNHYDRLHLHTYKSASGLPGYPMPNSYPRYPARAQVVSYLEDYAVHHGIAPEFDTEVQAVRSQNGFTVETSNGTRHATDVIFAAGMASFPYAATWPGLGGFAGQVLHSSTYKNPTPFAGKRVLVVGFGNSGGEIAMDLAEAGIATSLAVRGPVNLIPRDLLGIPIQGFAMAQRVLPYKLADAINAPVMRLALGNTAKLGLPKANKGPLAQIVEDGRIPLIDIGTLKLIRAGKIAVTAGLSSVSGHTISFADGATADFDVIVLATGYRPDLRAMLPDAGEVLTETGAPKVSGGPSGCEGLYFCGYRMAPTGVLREIGLEAERIAAKIAA